MKRLITIIITLVLIGCEVDDGVNTNTSGGGGSQIIPSIPPTDYENVDISYEYKEISPNNKGYFFTATMLKDDKLVIRDMHIESNERSLHYSSSPYIKIVGNTVYSTYYDSTYFVNRYNTYHTENIGDSIKVYYKTFYDGSEGTNIKGRAIIYKSRKKR